MRGRLRWLAWVYLGLLLASHIVRRIAPRPHPADPDELIQTVLAERGDHRTGRPVHIAYRQYLPGTADSTVTVLLVHGSPGDNGEVSGIARILGERYRTIAPDLPGFGGSTWDVPDYSNRAHAEYLLQLLDSLHIARVHLLGFSMGGGVVLQLEALAPDRVRSITMLSAIGAQEYELLGDYHLNHAIHGLQLAGLWLLREGTPQFGWLDDAMLSVAYARNFYDTDQRPLRGILQRYAGPMLILQGEHDVLVNPALAREHARIVPQAELYMDQGDHFTAFTRPGDVAAQVGAFVAKVERGAATVRATAQPDRIAQAERPFDPRDLPRVEGFSLAIVLLLLAAATLISEDLTCITAGLMIARGSIGFVPGVLACFAGIFVGDLLVFLSGRVLGRVVLGRAPLRWFLSADAVAVASQWVERRGARLVFITRVVPGTRLPSYFAAGMLRTSMLRFALYFFVACAIWTPILVGLAAAFGEAVQQALSIFRERMALYLLVAGLVLFVVLKLLLPLSTWRGRRLLLSRWRRLTRWEFWPRWAFYPPVVLYILWLAFRNRGLTVFTAANPAIPGGGFVGESKAAILEGLAGAGEIVAPWVLLPTGMTAEAKLARVRAQVEEWGGRYPVVLKPDIGERGSGVAIVQSEEEARTYLEAARGDLMVQRFAPGREFGVFYYRRPGEETGRVFSITDKRLLFLTGDGEHTLEELILQDDRAVCMAPHHFRRHARELAEVIPRGQSFTLVEVGTHARGALFLDGEWVRTPAMEAAIDRLSRTFEGFYFGRYDIRTERVDEFQQGRGFQVVELNGATAEATSIYDPSNRLFSAYRTLFVQWRLLFEIAAENVRRGAKPATLGEVWALMRRHRQALGSRR
ncbi:MAG TPA: alpha/beta fold hydrolase [Gemmatimonadales bacterium]|nr:alpha/beta fold hydrolase [Gemmatimonadales bacterium]